MREVIINAYPKSGVTWLLHLICDLLEGQHQDTDQMEPLTYNHPITSDWIVRKNHYPHWNAATPYLKNKAVIFTQRDPRDVVVSAMFYRKQADLELAIEVMIKSDYVGWVESWLKPGELKVKQLITTSYEALHFQPEIELANIISELTGDPPTSERIEQALNRQSFQNMVGQLGGDRHFMRRGIVGDWRNHFNQELAEWFNEHFGEFMIRQGYVDNLEWWESVGNI